MINSASVNAIKNLYRCIETNIPDTFLEILDTTDMVSMGESLLEDTVLPENKHMVSYTEFLTWYLVVCSFIENETDVPSVITDELYDKLVGRLMELGEPQLIGSPNSTIIGIGERQHKYPELRGSLAKVHFIWDKEVPKKDSRKSLESYLRNVVRQLDDNNIPYDKLTYSVDIKYDGVSHILECEGDKVQHILTRGNVATNNGKDITPIFKKVFPSDTGINFSTFIIGMDLMRLPEALFESNISYGVKVETYMNNANFQKYIDQTNLKRCNRRSATTSICNQSPDNLIVDKDGNSYIDFIQMQHFQIATDKKVTLKDSIETNRWTYIGKINNRHQYLYTSNNDRVNLTDINNACERLSKEIESVRNIVEQSGVPCDGAVISFLDTPVVETLGRRDNKNLFQVAFKFPAGYGRTTIEDVEFQVGPLAGNVTPVAKVSPIVINGNTIKSITLSNHDKFDRLQLRKGDEVIVKYDIIPMLFKDGTCKVGDGELFVFPERCPVCDHDLSEDRCFNKNCSSKIVGQILNFIHKVDIKGGLGYQTVIDFVDAGMLSSIGDLFRLYRHRDELYKLPSYGKVSIDNIIEGISESRKMYPHILLGSIGIPYVGRRIMEKICRNVDVISSITHLEKLIPEFKKIPGIGDVTIEHILTGVEDNKDLISDILEQVELIPYEKAPVYTDTVCFSNIRDKAFEEFLEQNGVKVAGSLTKAVNHLIVPDVSSNTVTTKMETAIKRGIDIISITKAKEKWGYN